MPPHSYWRCQSTRLLLHVVSSWSIEYISYIWPSHTKAFQSFHIFHFSHGHFLSPLTVFPRNRQSAFNAAAQAEQRQRWHAFSVRQSENNTGPLQPLGGSSEYTGYQAAGQAWSSQFPPLATSVALPLRQPPASTHQWEPSSLSLPGWNNMLLKVSFFSLLSYFTDNSFSSSQASVSFCFILYFCLGAFCLHSSLLLHMYSLQLLLSFPLLPLHSSHKAYFSRVTHLTLVLHTSFTDLSYWFEFTLQQGLWCWCLITL